MKPVKKKIEGSGLSGVWRKTNLFDPKTIEQSRVKFIERGKLLFRKPHYSFDTTPELSTIVKYKHMNGKTYVLKVEQYPPKTLLEEDKL